MQFSIMKNIILLRFCPKKKSALNENPSPPLYQMDRALLFDNVYIDIALLIRRY